MSAAALPISLKTDVYPAGMEDSLAKRERPLRIAGDAPSG